MAKTAKDLIRKMGIVEENVLGEAAEQAKLFTDAAIYRVLKMRDRSQAELTVEQMESTLGLKFRRRGEARGEKITVDEVKARIQSDSGYREARGVLEAAKQREELAKLILEALRQRRDGIKIIAEAAIWENVKDDASFDRTLMHKKLAGNARALEAKRRRAEEE